MKYSTTFEEKRFRRSVDKALERVQTILDTTRQPLLAQEDEDHTYDDKFALVEFLTNMGIAAKLNALERLGLDSEKLAVASKWVHDEKQAVTLRFQAQDSCTFVKENLVQKTDGTSVQIETTKSAGIFGMASEHESRNIRMIHMFREHHWNVGLEYQLVLFKGSDPNSANASSLLLYQRSVSSLLITSGGQATGLPTVPTNPFPQHTVHPPVDVNLTWLFKRLSPRNQSCNFFIHRQSVEAKRTCKTPRRNENIDDAVKFEQQLDQWANQTKAFFLDRVERTMVGKHQPVESPTAPGATLGDVSSQSAPLHGISANVLFGPILPLMEKGAILSKKDTSAFLNEQNRSIDQAVADIAKTYPPHHQTMKLISVAEATIVLMCQHIHQLFDQYCTGVDYVEDMLKQQFIQAIGKEVTSRDFDQFMRFHQKKLFGPRYAPKPFCYAIRRPEHYPDGVLSIEATATDGEVEPIATWVRHIPGGSGRSPIFLPINAATSVELRGACFLHGWMQHRFYSSPDPKYQVVARARQFSSFLLIVGTMMGPDTLDPKNAIILQNKDEVLIPLLTNTLPSAKEFKDAIASLSPEQQDFARSFRAMQLESSVFGVCIVQLKPQLERLLKLPDGALTKEIQLTQELMSLFVDYQIPSDLLSFDGANHLPPEDKVKAVKTYVQAVMTVIEGEKNKQLSHEVMKADMRYEMNSIDVGSQRVTPAQKGFSFGAAPAAITPFGSTPSPFGAPTSAGLFGSAPAAFGTPASSGLFGSAPASSKRQCETSQVMFQSSPLPAAFGGSPQQQSAANVTANSIQAASRTPPMTRTALASNPMVASATPPDASSAPSSAPENTPAVEAQKDAVEAQKETVEPLTALNDQNDFTAIPKILDRKLEKFDTDNALRSTIIKAGQNWIRKRQANLLTTASPCNMTKSDIETEKKKAFDLLDAISRSGTLAIESTELHVLIAISHCFENDIMGTIIQDNVNPIAKVERSALLLGSTIHNEPPASLLAKDRNRLTNSFPELLTAS